MCGGKPSAPPSPPPTSANLTPAEKPRTIRRSLDDGGSARRRQVRNIIGESVSTFQLGGASTGKQQLGA